MDTYFGSLGIITNGTTLIASVYIGAIRRSSNIGDIKFDWFEMISHHCHLGILFHQSVIKA